MQRKKNIQFTWVPSHIRIIGNEKAEKYAHYATKSIPNPTINTLTK